MRRQKNEAKSLNLAVYFAILVGVIVLVSIFFKIVDIVKNSRFDSGHNFSVALIGSGATDVVSLSPGDGTLTKLSLGRGENLGELGSEGVPIDAYINSSLDLDSNPKATFTQAVLHRNNIKTNLTILDLVRLAIYSRGIGDDKIIEKNSSVNDPSFSALLESLFVDPTILNEKVSIQITNATQTPGLGNKIAKYISDIGGDVVLVNSSPNALNSSAIYYKTDSYTVDRLSKNLDIPKIKKTENTISDVTIIIGKDKSNF